MPDPEDDADADGADEQSAQYETPTGADAREQRALAHPDVHEVVDQTDDPYPATSCQVNVVEVDARLRGVAEEAGERYARMLVKLHLHKRY